MSEQYNTHAEAMDMLAQSLNQLHIDQTGQQLGLADAMSEAFEAERRILQSIVDGHIPGSIVKNDDGSLQFKELLPPETLQMLRLYLLDIGYLPSEDEQL